MAIKHMDKKLRKNIGILLLFFIVFIIGSLLSSFYCFKVARIHDYTICNGIYIYDSETKQATIYAYYPYRNTTVVPTYTGSSLIIWMKQGDSYLCNFTGKHGVGITDKPLTRLDILERFGNSKIADALMTDTYVTEFIISQTRLEGYDVNGNYTIDPELDLIPMEGKENLSYAFCKVSGHMNGNQLDRQPPEHPYFAYRQGG